MAFLNTVLFGNSVRAWGMALIASCAAVIILLVLKHLARRHFSSFAHATPTLLDDVIVDALARTRTWAISLGALWIGSILLTLPPKIEAVLSNAATLAVLIQIGIWTRTALRSWVKHYAERAAETEGARVTTMHGLILLGEIALWIVLLLVGLENVGVDVTALIASLGILGIAIGFGLQNVLGDLFSTLSIMLDKPFQAGDFIVFDTWKGNVEHVGFKSTRIRSLSGEQLIISNGELLKKNIHNYKRMQERRVTFTLGVLYSTPKEKLEQIPGIVREIIEKQPVVRFDRGHFARFGPYSLDFEFVYWILDAEYMTYMDTHQTVNFEIIERFRSEGIEFAFPTQTVHVERT